MSANAAPVVDEADEDKDNDHYDFDHCKPVLGFAWTCSRMLLSARLNLMSEGPRTVHPYVDQLHRKNRQNDHQGILPRRDVWVPVLYAHIIRDERMKVNGYTYL